MNKPLTANVSDLIKKSISTKRDKTYEEFLKLQDIIRLVRECPHMNGNKLCIREAVKYFKEGYPNYRNGIWYSGKYYIEFLPKTGKGDIKSCVDEVRKNFKACKWKYSRLWGVLNEV